MTKKPSPPHADHKERFKRALAKRFFLRFHMSLILGTTIMAGVGINRLLLALGLDDMGLRYGAAVIVSYLIFLLCIRLWLTYITRAHRAQAPDAGDVVAEAFHHMPDLSIDLGRLFGSSRPSGETVSPPDTGKAGGGGFFGSGRHSETGDAAGGSFFGGEGQSDTGKAAGGSFFGGESREGSGKAGGGSFFGGGSSRAGGGPSSGQAAGAVWLNAKANDGGTVRAGGSGGKTSGSGDKASGSSWFDGIEFDFDTDEPGALVALIVLVLIVVVVAGAGIYLIWEAPAILAEAAFEAALVWSLKKRATAIDHAGWVGSVTKATVIPFAIILVVTVGSGMFLQFSYPKARTLSEVSRYEELYPATGESEPAEDTETVVEGEP